MPLQTRQGPPKKRRSNTKSRSGCSTCKRRHIRCDEEHPQCRNCTKHKVKCSYHDTPSQVVLLRKAPSLNRQPNARSISKARPWSAEAKTVVRHWRETRSMPISDDRIGATLDPHIFSDDDLHFVYQLVKNQHRLENMGVSKLTVASSYLPTFFRIIPWSRFAMNGVLALSAHQVASVTDSEYTRLKKVRYQTLAIQELRECLSNLQPKHVDAALVTSLALLWLCEDMSSRGRIAVGISAILQTYERSDHQSEFCHMIAHAWGQTANIQTTPNPGCGNTSGLQKIIKEMRKFAEVLGDHEPDDGTWRQLILLIALAEDMVKVEPITSTDKQSEWFQLLHYNLPPPLRDLLTDKDVSSMLMVNAYLHAVTLYSPPQLTQPCLIDLRVDLPSLLDETLQQVRSIDAYVRLLKELKAIVLSR
ncbi:hypothetical protein BFJ67_g16768 [Fusarium oxysporum f. sp. cepae]|nr:hypothetical protein BFJ67_g16768 [Fusarium oxysporum f. sp. cepae]